jgi:hypothetical protein
MTRVIVVAVALAGLPLLSQAEEPAVQFAVSPMGAPKPALKYQLLPELHELNAGNAAHNYLKCFMEQRKFFYTKETVAERVRYQTMPLAELPLDKLRDYGRNALRQADWAARLDTNDWQDLKQVQDGDLEPVPPGVGPLQVLAAALHVRFRAEVAGRRFDDAIRTAKTMFALARHLGEHPSEVAGLVGLWTAHLALNTLAEMVQQPGCPNLYWALTDLPCPLVDLRKGVHGQRTLLAAELRGLRDDAPMTDAEIGKFVDRYCSMRSFEREQAGEAPRNQRLALQARVKDVERVAAAGRRLVETGCAEAIVNRFPPLQIILLDEKRAYEIERDERMKLLALPLRQIDSLVNASSPQTPRPRNDGAGFSSPLDAPTGSGGGLSSPLAPASGERGGGEGAVHGADGLFMDRLPDIIKLRRTQGQLEQQVALLRLVEALRLYAAEHDGKLPAQLADTTVPLPADPVAGKPFNYTLERTTAHIHGNSLSGENGRTEDKPHYSVAVKR